MAGLKRRMAGGALAPLIALFAAGIGAAVWAGFALAAPSLAAPTITSGPANPTNQTSATFTYTEPQSVTFQCQLDSGGYASCGSGTSGSKSYSGLAAGSHTFQVSAVSNKTTSSASSYTWVIDLTPLTISRTDSNPTNASPLHWTVGFSEPVRNVVTSDFALVTSGLGGTPPTISSVIPVGSSPAQSWVVTVSTSGTTAVNGSIGLNLVSRGNPPIQDVAGNPLAGTLPFVGQAYTFDTTPPTVTAIARTSASPTNASSVSWPVTFSEAVTGVATGNFSLVLTGLTGTIAVTGVTGSGTTWTVTASTGTSTPSNGSPGTLQLNLRSTTGIKDLGGNTLASTFSGTDAVYLIDKFTPSPVFTQTPPDPNSTATSTFAWTEQEAGDTFLCSEENGPFNIACSSPFTYAVTTTNNGQHQFAVEARDALGNVSSLASYRWKVPAGSIQNFTISGNLQGLLYPGGQAQPVAVALTNPNSVPIYVTSISVSIISGGLPSGCQASWFTITQSNASDTNPVTVPANGSVTLPPSGVTAPTIRMIDSNSNQGACIGASFSLSYSGGAHS